MEGPSWIFMLIILGVIIALPFAIGIGSLVLFNYYTIDILNSTINNLTGNITDNITASDNNWTGQNIFFNVTIVNFTSFNVTGNTTSDFFCLNGICINDWTTINSSGKKGDGNFLFNDSDTMFFNDTKLSEQYANRTEMNLTIDIKINESIANLNITDNFVNVTGDTLW